MHKILTKEELSFQASKKGKKITFAQSPKVDTNIYVLDNAKVLDCNIQSIHHDNNAVIVYFYGDKDRRKCLASMTVSAKHEDIIHEYMKKRQHVDIDVIYEKRINPRVLKIKGQLLKINESDTQTGFIDF
jgi:hypothetical protein